MLVVYPQVNSVSDCSACLKQTDKPTKTTYSDQSQFRAESNNSGLDMWTYVDICGHKYLKLTGLMTLVGW